MMINGVPIIAAATTTPAEPRTPPQHRPVQQRPPRQEHLYDEARLQARNARRAAPADELDHPLPPRRLVLSLLLL